MSRLFYQVMQDNLGNLLFGVSGTMRLHGEGALATIYGDEALTIILPNPMTNHPSFASFKCYLGAGSFDFYMAKAGYTFETLTGVPGQGALGTMAEQDANAVAITGGTAQFAQLGLGIGPQSGFPLYVQGPSTLVGNVSMQGGSLAIGGAADGVHLVVAEGRIKTHGMTVVNLSGDNTSALYTNLAAAGGTNRYAIQHAGDAPSTLGGTLEVLGNMGVGIAQDGVHRLTVNGRVRASGVTVPTSAGDNVSALFTDLAAAGGTGRYALYLSGDAPSYVGGHVGVTAFPSASARVRIQYPKQTIHGLWIQPSDNDTGTAAAAIFCNLAGVGVGDISTTATTTSYGTSSDARLKHDVTPLTGALDVVQRLRPVAFRWKSDDSPGHGFLASEVQQVVDGVITGDKDATNPDGTVKPQQIDHSKLVVWLVGACKDLAAQVQALTARLDAAGS